MMREGFFEERGIYYRVNDIRTDTPALVFLHGVTGSSSAWIPYERHFENAHTVLSLDLRGHGKSAKPPKYEDYAVEGLARDIADLLVHLQIVKFIVVSHSFGALIGLEFLLSHPEGAIGSIFCSPTFDIRSIGMRRLTQPFLEFLSAACGLLPFRMHRGYHVDYERYRNTGDWNVRRIYADIKNTTLHVSLFCLTRIYHFDRDELWSRLEMPVLLIHGRKDSVIPLEHSVRMKSVVKNSELIVLEQANHVFVLKNIAEVCSAIETFVTRNNVSA